LFGFVSSKRTWEPAAQAPAAPDVAKDMTKEPVPWEVEHPEQLAGMYDPTLAVVPVPKPVDDDVSVVMIDATSSM
jgi:hypothetical protein